MTDPAAYDWTAINFEAMKMENTRAADRLSNRAHLLRAIGRVVKAVQPGVCRSVVFEFENEVL